MNLKVFPPFCILLKLDTEMVTVHNVNRKIGDLITLQHQTNNRADEDVRYTSIVSDLKMCIRATVNISNATAQQSKRQRRHVYQNKTVCDGGADERETSDEIPTDLYMEMGQICCVT